MGVENAVLGASQESHIQRGEQVFDTLPILQVFLLTKHVEVCIFFIIGTLKL